MCWTWSMGIDARFLYVFVSCFYLVWVVSDFSNVPSFTSTRRNCNLILLGWWTKSCHAQTMIGNRCYPCGKEDCLILPVLNNAVLHGRLWLIFMCLNPPFQLNKKPKTNGYRLRLSSTIFHPWSKNLLHFWDHGYPPSFGGFQMWM